MDTEPRSDLLIPGPGPARRAAVRLTRAAALFVALGCRGGPTTPPPDLPAVGRQISLLRFPRDGGPVRAFLPDSLTPAGWETSSSAPPLSRVVGVDLDERIAYALDTNGNLVGVDLEARGVRRSLMAGVGAAAMGPDGTLYVARADGRIIRLVRRAPIELTQPLAAVPGAMFGTVSGSLVAVTSSAPRRLLLSGGEGRLHEAELPDGRIVATYWGDLIAVAADTAVVLVETIGEPTFRSTRLGGRVRDVAFSPSGHRLYVARESRDIVVLDRYGLGALPSIRLPGAPRAIRTDASGRWLLARAAAADSVWTVDLATGRPAATLPTEWGPDLPLVAGAATLLTRQGGDLVAWDLRSVPPTRLAALPGGGADTWLAVGWVPRERLPAAVAAAESAIMTQDGGLAADTVTIEADSTETYVQVSSSQNEDRARELAEILRREGLDASVLRPEQDHEAYRVVVGPFPTREAADTAGRRLGRPYFILRRPRP